MRNLTTLSAILAMSLLITGCPDSGGTGTGTNENDNESMMNDNVVDDDMGGGSTTLSTISFDGDDVAVGEGPVTFDIGGGSISFVGGDVGTRGVPPLYGDGASSWNVDPEDSPSTITFSDLAVTGVMFYFAESGSTGATITARDADGAMIGDPIASVATTSLGDPAGFLNLEAPAGMTIATLTIEFDEGAAEGDVVAVDTMTLTVESN